MTPLDTIFGFALLIGIVVLVLVGFSLLVIGIDDLIIRQNATSVGVSTLLYAVVLISIAFYLLLFILPDFLKDVIARA